MKIFIVNDFFLRTRGVSARNERKTQKSSANWRRNRKSRKRRDRGASFSCSSIWILIKRHCAKSLTRRERKSSAWPRTSRKRDLSQNSSLLKTHRHALKDPRVTSYHTKPNLFFLSHFEPNPNPQWYKKCLTKKGLKRTTWSLVMWYLPNITWLKTRL